MRVSIDDGLQVVMARTLDEMTDFIAATCLKSGSGWWYRGHPDAGWQLVPKIWRGYTCQQERYLTNLFYQGAKLRHSNFPPDNDYAGWLALMQHYGLPTRLMDWSKSVLIASYFATKFERDMRIANPEPADAAIWMLDPCGLNEAQGYGAVFPSLNAESLQPMIHRAFKDTPQPESPNRKPYDVLAAVPVNHDLRMLMQQGTFTVHASSHPLTSQSDCDTWLKKIVIPGNCVRDIALSLDLLGICLADVFPDLEHLARQITNMHRPSPP